MEYLPLFLDVRGRCCAVVGGGAAAARKTRLLLRAGAQVRVHAAVLDDTLSAWLREGRIAQVTAPLHAACFDGCCLAIIALDDEAQARDAAALARARDIPVNVVDRPRLCTCIMPAIVDRSPVLVAISTAGAAPVLGRLLRARLEALLPARLGRLAELARALRPRVAAVLPAARRRAYWETVLQGPIAELVFAGRDDDARAAMDAGLDAGVSVGAGEVYLVGTPADGDPEQLTLRALRLLQQADVVFLDPALPRALSDLIRRDAECREADPQADAQPVIDALSALALAGRRVAWLTTGATAPAHGATLEQRLLARGVSVLRA